MRLLKVAVATLALLFVSLPLHADPGPLRFGVGLFQPDREKNDATYRPLDRGGPE